MILVKILVSLCLAFLFLFFMISVGAGLTALGLAATEDGFFRKFLTILGHSLPALFCASVTYFIYVKTSFKSTALSFLVIAPIFIFYLNMTYTSHVFDIFKMKSLTNSVIFLLTFFLIGMSNKHA